MRIRPHDRRDAFARHYHRTSSSFKKKTGTMQAAMTMNTLGLAGAARPSARVSAKKASVFGAPKALVGKSTVFSVRRSVAPHGVRVMAAAEPIMEPLFKGIKDDLAARGPLYLDDFKQGISTKSLVRDPLRIIRLNLD
jgi:hypothetical protein|tara:strand:+ start:6522 stop:6935 length:414 start_codon:yes stop_codon:yes gene_type:complete